MKIILSDKAKFQLKESIFFYEKAQKGLGIRFKNHLNKKVKFIGEHPFSSEIKYDKVHVAFLKTFPFSIHYLYEKELSTIFISAIFHTSRNPENLSL